MIAFDLKCINSHTFEGWFEDLEAYESQKEQHLLSCPVCDSFEIQRIPSKFAIKSDPLPDFRKVEIEKLRNKALKFIKENFDNVGSDFAKESLKIHYGVSEPRNIRGFSSIEEENTLRKEGIEFFKIPIPISSNETDTK